MDNLTTSYHNKAAAMALLLLIAVAGVGLTTPAAAQEAARWYQIEISIFTNENSNLSLERWPVARMGLEFPRNARRLTSLMDVLNIDDWALVDPPLPRSTTQASGHYTELTPPRSEGPEAFQPGNFRLPDFERDAFLTLPASAHNFTDTNRALNSSANYRLLYHSAWRQPVVQGAQVVPVVIQAGRLFGERHELEGSVSIRFNPSQDRVVLDTLMWLTQFSTFSAGADENHQLPALPQNLRPRSASDDDAAFDSGVTTTRYYPQQIIPVRLNRDMRSNEFHYVDHPALGIVIQVFPYTPPPLPVLSLPGDQIPL